MVAIGQRLFRLVCIPMLAASLTTSADAQLPAVLDRIPPGGLGVTTISSLHRFDQNTSDLITSLEMDAISTFSQVLGALGLRDGLDMQGSAAGVFYPSLEDDATGTPRIVLVLPLKSYDLFTKNMRASSENGIERFDYAQTTYYARKLTDPFAAISVDEALVRAFPDENGSLASHEQAIGARGMRIARAADVIAIMPVDQVAPMIATMGGLLLQRAQGLPIPGIGDEDDPQSSFARALLDRIKREGQTATLALSASPLGLKIDIAVQFRGGSEMAQLAQGAKPRSGNLFAHFPNDPALLVGSVNLAHSGVSTLIADALDGFDVKPSAEMDLASQLSLATVRSLESMKSASVAVYSPPAMFNGLLSRTAIVWEGDEPSSIANNFEIWLESVGQQETLITTYSSDAQRIASAQVDAWTITPNSAAPVPDPLFGMGGIKGFISVDAEHGLMLWNQDEAFAASVLNPTETLTNDLMLSQVGDLLPVDRVVEVYLNPGPILTMTAPMLALFTGGQPLDVPEMLPPIGASISLSDGALHVSIFVPTPIIRLAIDAAELVGAGLGEQ